MRKRVLRTLRKRVLRTLRTVPLGISRTCMAVRLYARHVPFLARLHANSNSSISFCGKTQRVASSAANRRTHPRPKSHSAQDHPNIWAVRHFIPPLEWDRMNIFKKRRHFCIDGTRDEPEIVPKLNGMAKSLNYSQTLCNAPITFWKEWIWL